MYRKRIVCSKEKKISFVNEIISMSLYNKNLNLKQANYDIMAWAAAALVTIAL